MTICKLNKVTHLALLPFLPSLSSALCLLLPAAEKGIYYLHNNLGPIIMLVVALLVLFSGSEVA